MVQEILTDIFSTYRYNRYTNHFQGNAIVPPQRKDVSTMHNPSRSQLLRRPRVPRMLYESCGGFLSGLLLAGTYVGNMTSPLPIAIAANLGSAGAVSVLAGSLISYLISNTMLDNLPLLFALVVVVCLRVMKRPAKTSAGIACSTGLCVFFSGIVVSLLFHASGAEVIGYTMTAALTGCASYFMHAVFASVRATGKIPLRSTDGCAAAVVLILTVAAFSCYGIPSMNAGGIISVAVTLIGAKKFRCAGGVICGALSACGAILGSPEAGMPLLILPVGGLLVGYLAEKNRFLIAGVFFLFSLMALITFGTSLLQISAVINLFLGSAAFLFLDSSWLDKWLVTDLPDRSDNTLPLSSRLQYMADAIRSVREDTDAIAAILPQEEPTGDATREVCETVCGSCRHKLRCWESAYEETLTGFRKMESHLGADQPPIPEELAHCSRKERLRALFSRHAADRRKARFLAARTAESRTVLLEQLAAAEDLLHATSDHLHIRYSSELSDTVRRKLLHYGYPCDSAAVYHTQSDRLMIEMCCQGRELDGCLPTIKHILSESLNLTLEELDPIFSGDTVRYRLCQRPKYRLEHFTSALHASQETISGDTALLFTDNAGNPYLVLSDGMGTGKNAAIESRMTTELFRKFISGGICGTAAIRMMNGLLLTKSPQETFATLDVARFDLDAGEMTMMKSGAAATLIRHGGKVSRISATTFPLGLEPEGEASVRHVMLYPDDIILMLSDGVSEETYPLIRQLLESSSDLEQIVMEICDKAEIFAGGNRRDDVTVCAARLLQS